MDAEDRRADEAVGVVRGLVTARDALDRVLADAITEAVADALRAGVMVTALAEVLGVHRATLYRQFGVPICRKRLEDARGRMGEP